MRYSWIVYLVNIHSIDNRSFKARLLCSWKSLPDVSFTGWSPILFGNLRYVSVRSMDSFWCKYLNVIKVQILQRLSLLHWSPAVVLLWPHRFGFAKRLDSFSFQTCVIALPMVRSKLGGGKHLVEGRMKGESRKHRIKYKIERLCMAAFAATSWQAINFWGLQGWSLSPERLVQIQLDMAIKIAPSVILKLTH